MSWELIVFIAVIVGWIAINRWVLPKMGIRT